MINEFTILGLKLNIISIIIGIIFAGIVYGVYQFITMFIFINKTSKFQNVKQMIHDSHLQIKEADKNLEKLYGVFLELEK